MSDKLTFQEAIDSLTGYEEMAVAEVTGQGLEFWGAKGRRLVVARAVAAVLVARSEAEEGAILKRADVKKAWDKVQAMKQSEVDELYADDEEVMPDEPVTEQGKDDSEPGSVPESSPSSASEPE